MEFKQLVPDNEENKGRQLEVIIFAIMKRLIWKAGL